MTQALQRHQAGDVRIVPVIVEPCDWKASPLGQLKALPLDGKPVTAWPSRDEAFLDVVKELRRILEPIAMPASTAEHDPPSQSRQYRVMRTFDEVDRSKVRDAAFNEIREIFRSAVAELGAIVGVRGSFQGALPRSFSCAVVNQMLSNRTFRISVHADDLNVGFGDIYFQWGENALAHGANGGFYIEADEHELHLRPWPFHMHDGAQWLSPRDAAELLWSQFLEQVGVGYA